MNNTNEKQIKCPFCGSDQLLKYLYGFASSNYNKEKYILGGCIITENQPIYKCKKCNKDIYPNSKKDSINEGVNNLSFEDLVKSKVLNSSLADIVIKYFKEEIKTSDRVSLIIFKNLSKYDDILNEFTRYLTTRTYDINNAIEVDGYTAKKIHQLNPSFNASGVYTFLSLFRSDPKRAKTIIDNNFMNKDSKPRTTDSSSELEEKMLKEIEQEVDQEMIKMGLLTIKDGKKIPVLGSCHRRWAIEKKLLKERYNYDWKTPQEKNPEILYD